MAISLMDYKLLGSEHHSYWLGQESDKLFSAISVTLMDALKVLGLEKNEVCLVGLGISGAISVPRIAHTNNLPFALCRRQGEETSARAASGIPNSRLIGRVRSKAIFIDDLIDHGTTLLRVKDVLSAHRIDLAGVIVAASCGETGTIVPKKYMEYAIRDEIVPLWVQNRRRKWDV